MPDLASPASPVPATEPETEPETVSEPALPPDSTLILRAWQNMFGVAEPVRQALSAGAAEYARARRQSAFVHDYVGGLREMMIIIVKCHGMTRSAAAIVVECLIAQHNDR